jgi:hypothetical protein
MTRSNPGQLQPRRSSESVGRSLHQGWQDDVQVWDLAVHRHSSLTQLILLEQRTYWRHQRRSSTCSSQLYRTAWLAFAS